MAKKSAVKEPAKDARLELAHERYKQAETAWSENRKLALKDIEFRAGKQWPDDVVKARGDRPCLTVDKIGQYVRQVVNDGRQNRPSVNVRPVDDEGDIKVADAFKGLIRSICSRSNADEAFDTALDCAATSGFGYFRVLTEYVSEDAFEQDIVVRRIRNPLAVLLDPTAQMADGSDAEYGFVIDSMSKIEFERRFPDAQAKNWESDGQRYCEGWMDELTVRVCEYWYKETEKRTIYLLADGTTTDAEEYQAAQAEGVDVPPVLDKRDSQVLKVKWCRMSGAEILEERDWAGKYIPIVPVYGSEYDIDGKVVYAGLVRPARDPCMLYNYSRSAFAERVALVPKSPYMAAVGQVEDQPEWETANSENHSVLKYNPIDINGHPVPPPQRVSAADVPAGFQADMQLSEHDIQASIGMYAASLGQASNEKSGRAIMARQREGDTATFHYQDNLNRAVRQLGRILVDLIPKIYDTRRVVRILGEDNESEMAMVDPSLPTATDRLPGKSGVMTVFNLNVGRYDVDVSAGPSYTTKRQESAEAMIEMMRANPAFAQTHGDLIVKAQDWPGAQEFAERSKALMPPEVKAAIAQAEQQEDDEGPSEEVRAVVEQATQAVQMRDQQIQEMQGVLQQAGQKIGDLERTIEALKEKGGVEAQKLSLQAREQLILEREKAAAAEEELRSLQLKQAMEDIAEQAVEQIKALVVPEPSIQQPEAVAPAGPSPEVLAILEQFQAQTNALMQAVTAPRIRSMQRPDGTVLTVTDQLAA